MLIPLLIVVTLITVTGGTLVAIRIWKKRQQGKPPKINYQVFLVMGIGFLGVGTVLMVTISPAFIGLSGIGAASVIISLANRNKW
jgi:hypothetical protein